MCDQIPGSQYFAHRFTPQTACSGIFDALTGEHDDSDDDDGHTSIDDCLGTGERELIETRN